MTQTIEAINRAYADVFSGQYALVYGEGDTGARLLLVGEAPGAREARLGRPFVGTAGKMLDAFLTGVGLAREALYITNAVKFRPTKVGTSGRLSNRPPTREEIALFRPWLLEEITGVAPRVIATLGNTPLRAVTGETLTIGDVHGAPMWLADGTALFPLYHPASVIYRRGLRAVYEEDIEKLRGFLAAMEKTATAL